MIHMLSKMKQNSLAFSLQENYTDCATEAGRRILVPAFVYRGLRDHSCGSPRHLILSFETGAAILPFK
jgi:hypothetical protein